MPRRPRRTLTAEFKFGLVLALLRGERTKAELCTEHAISPQQLSLWQEQLLAGGPKLFARPGPTAAEAQRVAELERLLGQQTAELDLLKKTLRRAGSLRPSGGSW